MRGFGTYVLWWIALFWLWLAYQGEWNRVEWIAAAAAATPAAALATALTLLGLLSFRIPFRLFRDAKSVPRQAAVDFGIITLALARRLTGRRVRGRSSSARSTRRAAARLQPETARRAASSRRTARTHT